MENKDCRGTFCLLAKECENDDDASASRTIARTGPLSVFDVLPEGDAAATMESHHEPEVCDIDGRFQPSTGNNAIHAP